MNEQPPRGLCCHEAGHAVVAHSFHLPVQVVRVEFTDERGWHGGTDVPSGAADHLDTMDQVVIWVAGRAAEKIFVCPAHESAWLHDIGQISVVLDRVGVAPEKHWAKIDEATKRARLILQVNRNKVLRLIQRLAHRPRIDRDEFLQLMGN
jgi:ATP-dependent Zn protease